VPEAVVDVRVAPTQRDYAKEQPVSDEVFKIYQSLFSYDKTALDVRVESTAENDERWHQAKITFNAAYGNERMEAVVFSPKNFPPPYQAVIYFPGSGAITQRSTDRLEKLDLLALLIGSGRVVVFPIYKGTYTRGDGLTSSYPEPTSFYRDHVIYWSKDLGRTIDYLETRKDIQVEKLAFLGNFKHIFSGSFCPENFSLLKADAKEISSCGHAADKSIILDMSPVKGGILDTTKHQNPGFLS